MQFNNLLTTITIALLASTPALAVDVTYRGYSNTVSCSGDNFFCKDGGAVCCSFPTGFGYSAQFENLPAGSQGQGYVDAGCKTFKFEVFGPGTKCWNGGGARAGWLNWFHSKAKRVVEENGEAEKECATPVGFEYQDGEGVKRTIAIPAGNASAAEEVAKHYVKKDWKALSAYESI